MIVKTQYAERLMKRCQIGVGGHNALEEAHSIMADCYGTIGSLMSERDELFNSMPSRKMSLEPIIINRLIVGDYSITQQSDGNYWIRRESRFDSNEGMQTTPAKLEKLIHDFYCEEF